MHVALAATLLVLLPLIAGAQMNPGSLSGELPEGQLPPGFSTSSGASQGAPTVLEGAVDPAKYMLGPGDVLQVVYAGRVQPAERVRVTPSGRIHLMATGPVEVAGLTLEAAGDEIRLALSEYYDDARISVDLVAVRRFRVHVLGHVSDPGAFEVAGGYRASDLLSSQTEIRDRASMRNMELRRQDGTADPVDLIRYQLLGDLDADPFLEDGDVLYVPARRDSVSVYGRVARPGFFEFRPGDRVDDLIALAGGFDSGADARAVELRRFISAQSDGTTSQNLDVSQGEGRQETRPGDGIYVRSQPNWRRERRVELVGEVRYPGFYAIERDKETLRTLIERAGGFTKDADPAGTVVQRPNVFDVPQDDPEFLRLQSIPISEMTNDEYEYLKLRSRQREGTASSILSLHLGDPEFGEDLVLRSGDRVEIPRQNLAVDVQGAVRNPGFVPYDPTRTASGYIELAGGVTERARTGKTRVIRDRTGERVKADDKTRVDPGDMVWVPENPDRDWWKLAREGAVFLASISTLIIVVDSVTRNN